MNLGPGDSQTWGGVTSSADPRFEDDEVYGECEECGSEIVGTVIDEYTIHWSCGTCDESWEEDTYDPDR